MSFQSECQLYQAYSSAVVMAQTFGHMEAQPGESHEGWFTFILGQHGDMVVIESEFKTFDEGPGYFSDRQEFIWQKVKDKGPCSAIGVYRFDGEYRRYKHANEKGLGRFVGKVTRVKV